MSSGSKWGDEGRVQTRVDLVEDIIGLLFQRMNLMRSIRQVGVPRGSPLHKQVGSLTNEFYLLLEVLKKLLITWKQIHAWTLIFSHRPAVLNKPGRPRIQQHGERGLKRYRPMQDL
jgi:hypothetical protein